MDQAIIIKQIGNKLTAEFPSASHDIIKRQEFIISSIMILVQILKEDHLKKGTDIESFNYQILESIKSTLLNKKTLLHSTK